MGFKLNLSWLVLVLMSLIIFKGCGDLEPDMQDTRTVILNMDFQKRSSSRSISSVSASALSQYNTRLIFAVPDIPDNTQQDSNYFNYNSSYGQEWVLMDSSDKVTLEIPLDKTMKIFAFLFETEYSLDNLKLGTQTVGYYGESQSFSIDQHTNNYPVRITLKAANSNGDGDEQEGTAMDSSLEAYYSFNGNANDSTSNGRNLSIFGNPTLIAGRDNTSNSAYNFNGDGDYLEYEANIPSFDNYTISLWAMPFSSGTYEAMFSSDNNSGEGFQIDLNSSNNFNIRKTNADGGNIVLSEADLGVWTFIAFTYDGNTSIGYIDNESPKSATGGTTKFNRFRIGRNRQGGTFFRGAIDELRIYNRALTASEISSLFAN